jgi:mannose-1-phosphate guanylyltransferase
MKFILLSGGAGKRLWPLSNSTRSKQFLQLLKNERNERESMVQRVWGQLITANLADSTMVSTCDTQVEFLRSQLGHAVPLIIEPERRDTFAAIALACTYLHSVADTDGSEVVCFSPVDPYVDQSFFFHVKELENIVTESGADIALIGVVPTYASEKYGYIVPDQATTRQSSKGYQAVSRFVEKPKEEQAESLIKENSLWNCGVFAFKLGFMLSYLKKNGLPVDYEEMIRVYGTLPKISFDLEVVEKTGHRVVLPYSGSWKDLGTWRTLSEELDTFLIGKGLISESSANTHVINELDIPVAVINISNVIVAVSADGILISDKAASSKIKEWLKDDNKEWR